MNQTQYRDRNDIIIPYGCLKDGCLKDFPTFIKLEISDFLGPSISVNHEMAFFGNFESRLSLKFLDCSVVEVLKVRPWGLTLLLAEISLDRTSNRSKLSLR